MGPTVFYVPSGFYVPYGDTAGPRGRSNARLPGESAEEAFGGRLSPEKIADVAAFVAAKP